MDELLASGRHDVRPLGPGFVVRAGFNFDTLLDRFVLDLLQLGRGPG